MSYSLQSHYLPIEYDTMAVCVYLHFVMIKSSSIKSKQSRIVYFCKDVTGFEVAWMDCEKTTHTTITEPW